MPASARVEVIVCNLGDGLVDVLKIVYFLKPVAKQVAEAIAGGNTILPQFRTGPWTVKKAMMLLLDKLPGYHISFASTYWRPNPRRIFEEIYRH